MRIRRALLLLSSQGLIELQSNRAAYVACPSKSDANDVFAARMLIEPPLVRNLAQNPDVIDLRVLVDHIELEDAAREQNAGYLHHRRHHRPRVWLKLAQSLDGRIATRTGASRWITSETSRRHAHRWRSWMDMVAVGAGTVVADDPALTVRHVRGPDPRALVVSARVSCGPEAQLFSRTGTVLATGRHDAAKTDAFSAQGADVWSFETQDDQIDLQQLVHKAGEEGITSLLIEGGRSLSAAALRAGIVDEVMIYVAPRLIGEGVGSVGDLGVEVIDDSVRLTQIVTRRLGNDLLYTGKVEPCSPV